MPSPRLPHRQAKVLRCARALIVAAFACGALPLHAQPDALYLRALAANCAQCHGTDGAGIAGSPLPPLAGQPRGVLRAKLQAFKNGTRPSTIMQQLARGYSDAQLEQLAAFFAGQTRP